MKKLIAIAMAVLMLAAAAAGCGGDNGATENSKLTGKVTTSVKVNEKETKESNETEETTEEQTTENSSEETEADSQSAEQNPTENEVNNDNSYSQTTTNAPVYEEPDPTDPPYVEPDPTDPPVQGGTFTSSDASFSYNGVSISIGTNIDSIVASIGEPSSKSEADSCYGEGKDYAYNYGSFTINTVPSNGVNIVNTVTVNTTPKGVSVGQSESAIVSAYGSSGKISDYLYSYTNGGTLNFYLSGGVITSIEYC